MEFAQKSPLKDGDEFVHQLMRVSPQHKTLAMRILEVKTRSLFTGLTVSDQNGPMKSIYWFETTLTSSKANLDRLTQMIKRCSQAQADCW